MSKKVEYNTIKEIAGPIVIVEGVEGVTYGELVSITASDGSKRLARCSMLEKGRRSSRFLKAVPVSTRKVRASGSLARR
jgi:vacuolar-type H+-ATPase subunit B/Vma2